jgi:predicted molibdopterin-dependent oxidoreductase YjgC
MIKNERGQLEPCSIEKAANIVVEKMVEANGDFAGIVSTRLPNETLAAFNKLMGDILGSKHIDTTDGDIYRTIQQGIKMFDGTGSNINIGCSIEEIAEADCVMVVGCDPEETNPVVGTLVRQALDKNDAKLIVINTSSDVFPLRTDIWLKPNIGTEKLLVDGLTKVLIDKGLSPKEDVNNKSLSELKDCQIETVAEITSIEKERIEIAAELYGNANKAVIIFGKNLIEEKNSEAIASLLRLADISGNKVGDKLRIIALSPNANSQGAWDLGIARNEDAIAGTQLFLLLGDDESKFNDTEFIRSISGAKTLVVQASYKSSITDMADVVLPSPIWAEREGSYVSMGGHTLEARKAIQPFDGLLSDKEVLTYIARVLGHELS